MKKLIDCFTFYNELEMLELRLTELYDIVDKFILVESDRTHKGEMKRLFFEENKWKYEKWKDKIIHVKVEFPSHLDVWGREKYQRNSFMPTLYSLGLSNDDLVVISDLDEIPDFNTLSYIKNSYNMKGLFKLEMDHYWASLYNKMISPEKWYHAKIVDWETLKSKTPDECRLDFNCQWWERGGWHLSYFGGPDIIINKINSTAHQELNHDKFKVKDEVIKKVREGLDLFDEWRGFQKINPIENQYLPRNWKILLGNEEKYGNFIDNKKNLVLGAAINLSIDNIEVFVESFRSKNISDDIYMLVEESASLEKINYLKKNSVNILYFGSSEILGTQPNNYRFLKFFDFLKENTNYNNILISDVSDVYFQSDPFEDLKGEFIFFAEEEDLIKIGENGFNSRWILQCFGNNELEKIKNNPIICCGTIIGSYNNVLEYCKKSSSEMMRVKNENPQSFSDMMDQGIHNYICYNNMDLFIGPSIKKNGDFFATVGITATENPNSILISGSLISVNEKTPRIIHQYNRSPELSSLIISSIELNEIKDNIIKTEIEGFSIVTLKNDIVGKSISEGNLWEPHIVSFLKKELTKDSVFVDIGSNYGWHSLIASSLCKKVYSFEPQKMMYNLQKESILKSKIKNIDVYPIGLGKIDSTANLRSIDYTENNINIGDLGIGSGGEEIKISTLDAMNLESVDIIKLDVQGYERYVLDGAENTINKNRPILIVEVEEFQLSKFNLSSIDIFEKIKSLEYEIYLMDHTYPSDHVCVPLEKFKDFEVNHKIEELKENNNISNSYQNGVRKKILMTDISGLTQVSPKRGLKNILDLQNINGFENKGGTDKETSHSYLETYERVLSKFLEKSPSILEIGVQYGGSSLLWHEYFEESNLVMMDISDQRGENIIKKMSPERYKFHIGDAYNEGSLENIRKENPLGFDILMDDGPHTLESQIFFIKNYIKLAKEGAVLIIEDIQDINHATILKEHVDKNHKVEIVDLRSEKGRYDDIMIIVYIDEKPKNKEEITIGWISHNPDDFNKFLGPSLERINGKFNTDSVPDTLKSSANYNILIERCKTKWIMLCHEDVAFSGDILDSINEAIEMYPDSKFFGFVGANQKGSAKSFPEKYDDLVTCDSCFIVLNLDGLDNRFDENTFDNYHLHVEDMCMQLGGNGKTILMNYLEPNEYLEINHKDKRWIHHGSTTYFQMGSCWGNYQIYKKKLNDKWNLNVPTT